MSDPDEFGDPIRILLVEDNPGDQELTRQAFKRGRLYNRLDIVEDGEQAMDYLHGRPPFDGCGRPDLILLDLNLPRKDGREVLAEIKQDPQLKVIPVIVLTTSEADSDVMRSYELNANSYMTKPVDFDNFVTSIQTLETFWFTVVKLPPGG